MQHRVTLGRLPNNDIVIDDHKNANTISGLHAEIHRVGDGQYRLISKGRNGMLVNGRAIKEVTLQEGDEVCFGDAYGLKEGEEAVKRRSSLVYKFAIPPRPQVIDVKPSSRPARTR